MLSRGRGGGGRDELITASEGAEGYSSSSVVCPRRRNGSTSSAAGHIRPYSSSVSMSMDGVHATTTTAVAIVASVVIYQCSDGVDVHG